MIKLFKKNKKKHLFLGLIDKSQHFLQLRFADQRSHSGALLQRVTQRDGLSPLHHLFQELGQDLSLHKHSGPIAADLHNAERHNNQSDLINKVVDQVGLDIIQHNSCLTCPCVRKFAMSAPFTAFSSSQSLKMRRGDFPPSSRVTCFTPFADISMT